MKLYRYRPRDNRTPVSHPVYGPLEWDKLVQWPEPILDPDFEEVEDEAKSAEVAKSKAPAATDTASSDDADAAKADGSK